MATVLYVDDEPVLRRAVSTWLGHQGVRVHATSGLTEAIAWLDAHEGEVEGVFVDIWLGDGSGFELYDWLLENRPALAPRTVFVTGDIVPTSTTLRQFAMLDRPVLIKPFDLGALDACVRDWRAAAGRTARAVLDTPSSSPVFRSMHSAS